MDRREHQRAFLNQPRRLAAGLLLAVGWLAAPGVAPAQQATPAGGGAPPSVAVPPDPALRKRAAERMAERRQRELDASDQEAQRRIDELPPDEQAAFKRNLRLWRQLTPEEREAMRREVADHTREEVERAYQASGLRLDKDGREVFGLRYRQERRKLERELQEKMAAERTRRLPGLVEGLKREFADKAAAPLPTRPAAPAASPAP